MLTMCRNSVKHFKCINFLKCSQHYEARYCYFLHFTDEETEAWDFKELLKAMQTERARACVFNEVVMSTIRSVCLGKTIEQWTAFPLGLHS